MYVSEIALVAQAGTSLSAGEVTALLGSAMILFLFVLGVVLIGVVLYQDNPQHAPDQEESPQR